jgi:2-oxoglutarate ferredoxin oxidoreductase subunit delta
VAGSSAKSAECERLGKVVINDKFCKGCALCISACPQRLLQTAGHVSETSYRPAEFADPQGKCTGCGICALICPDAAIQVYREKKVGVK